MHGELRSFVDHFNRGEYFEAHEILEAAWMTAPAVERYFLQGLIHLAVAWHHHLQGNRTGALLQIEKGQRKLAGYLPLRHGVHTAQVLKDALEWRQWMEEGRMGTATIGLKA